MCAVKRFRDLTPRDLASHRPSATQEGPYRSRPENRRECTVQAAHMSQEITDAIYRWVLDCTRAGVPLEFLRGRLVEAINGAYAQATEVCEAERR